jgi:predicted HicB family RNase H-like nuclease
MAKEKLIRFHARIPVRLKKQLAKNAAAEKRSLNQYILNALEQVADQRTESKATVETA